ncbi:MAG: gliding motility-associated C-terminal domain-containing protein [Bacteroidota bacterium]
MRAIIFIIFCFEIIFVGAQSLTFAENTTFSLGSNASFTFGGDVNFVGSLQNNGTIVSTRDLNFFNNQTVGKLKFIGLSDQSIIGDTLFVTDMKVDKTGNVKMETERVFVSGNLDVTSGVVQTDDINDLIVTGWCSEDGTGYVEGKLVGLSAGDPVAFPMGLNGFTNYITFSDTKPGVKIIVDCLSPDSSTLFPTEDMVGIADEVEWQVRTVADSTLTTMIVNFSGLDLINFSNGQPIHANAYAPALVVFQKGNSVYQILESSEAIPENSASTETSGRIVSTSSILIDTAITRVNVAWLPVVDGPEFFVPNVFSPNGFYEENRLFRPFFAGGKVTSVSIAVYNAYNDDVYRYSKNGMDLDLSSIGWDGKLKGGQPAEEGVYYYDIQLIADEKVWRKTSSMLLINNN